MHCRPVPSRYVVSRPASYRFYHANPISHKIHMKTLLTSVCALAVASAAFAQGTVNWSGPTFAAYTTETNTMQYSPLLGGGSTLAGTVGLTSTVSGSYFFELLYKAYTGNGSLTPQPGNLAQLAAWSDTGLSGENNTSTAGRDVVFTPNSAQIVPWASGVTDSVMLVEWSANLGTTWATALATLQNSSALSAVTLTGNAFLGLSATGFVNPSTSDTIGATLFSTGAQGSSGDPIGLASNSLSTQLYLVPVPEPGTIAMTIFGGLSLLALRRKK